MKIGEVNFEDFSAGERVVLWQYANAPRLCAMLQNEIDFFKSYILGFWKNWFDDVFNLNTANSFGISVWGKILGVTRPMVAPQNYVVDKENVLKFYNPNSDTWHTVWLVGNPNVQIAVEKNPPEASFATYPINDETYRRCLLAKIFLLHSNGSVNDINKYLEYLFPDIPCYCEDLGNMAMSINFAKTPSETQLAIITSEDFSPRPAGVFLNYSISNFDINTFGFEGQEIGTWGDNENTLDSEAVAQGLGTFNK